MRRALVALALVFAIAGPTAGLATAEGPSILVTIEGPIDQPLYFTGQGFQPGAGLRQALVHPDGTLYTVVKDGVEQVWVVSPEGNFIVILVPTIDFPNLGPGDWYTRFCTEDGAGCWEATFTITM